MRKFLRKLIIGSASIVALGIGGTALDYAADAGDAVNAGNGAPTIATSHSWGESHSSGEGAGLWKDDVRWAQVELRNRGLYDGSLDGELGPQTQRAVGEFQKTNGLDRTATLDPQTMQALTGDPVIGEGSSTPPDSGGASSMTNSSGAGN